MKEQTEALDLHRKLATAVEDLPAALDLWPAIQAQLPAALATTNGPRLSARRQPLAGWSGHRRALGGVALAGALLVVVLINPAVVAWAGQNINDLMARLGVRQTPVELSKPPLPPGTVAHA